jgi:hypothetical protein
MKKKDLSLEAIAAIEQRKSLSEYTALHKSLIYWSQRLDNTSPLSETEQRSLHHFCIALQAQNSRPKPFNEPDYCPGSINPAAAAAQEAAAYIYTALQNRNYLIASELFSESRELGQNRSTRALRKQKQRLSGYCSEFRAIQGMIDQQNIYNPV